jgi:hypothetical protein
MMENTDDLVLAVEKLSVVHDRYDRAHSDSTGTSLGDDGENRDNSGYTG